MKIILTGTTGFLGSAVLRQALDDAAIEQVLVLGRRSVGLAHDKLAEIVTDDFLDYSKIRDQLTADACIWCLGVPQAAVSQADYISITHDYAMQAARTMLALNPALRFCFVSGLSADQDEKSLTLQGRIKGRTEKHLSQLGPNVFNFRPGFIRPGTSKVKRPLVPTIFEPIAWVVDHFTDGFSVDTETLARCLIGVAKTGSARSLFDNRSIRQWRS